MIRVHASGGGVSPPPPGRFFTRHASRLCRRFCVVLLVLAAAAVEARGRYLELDQFLAQAFPATAPTSQVLWLNAEQKQAASDILQRRFANLRVRYWQQGETTAWVMDEIGKERPITIGVVIRDDRIDFVRILEFRESRGDEVRFPFFTSQFQGLTLQPGHKLSGPIDNITGATMSVNSVSRVARTALYFNALRQPR